MNKHFAKPLVIVLLSAGFGMAANRWSPRGIPVITPEERTDVLGEYLTLDQAEAFWRDGGSIFVDAREPADFAAGHIGNALNLPAQSFAEHFGELAPMLASDSKLVLYCDGIECDLSHRLAGSLRLQGRTNLHILPNGWTAWRQAGLPAATGGLK
jgi:rhodanese-related sulfurtransferase